MTKPPDGGFLMLILTSLNPEEDETWKIKLNM